MTKNIIFIFSLILILIMILIFIIFYTHYNKLKNNKLYKYEYCNKKLIWFFFISFWLLFPIILLEIISYILIFFNQLYSDYLFVISAFLNYILIIVYLLLLTFFNNSLWIKGDEMFLYFLDETILLTEIIGLTKGKLINKIIIEIEGEIIKKRIIGKKIFLFLEKIEN